MSEEPTKSKGKVYKCHQLLVCLFCIFLLTCVVSSIYLISEYFSNTRGLDGADGLLEEKVNDDFFEETGSKKITRRTSRVKRSLPSFDNCELQKRTRRCFSEITNRTEDEEDLNALLFQKRVARDTTSAERHQVKVDIRKLLQQDIVKRILKEKHGRKKIKSYMQDEEDDDDSYVASDVGSNVRHAKALNDRLLFIKKTSTVEVEHSEKANSKDKVKRPSTENIDYPEFPEDYHSSGLIILPHSGIAEPFEIWYAPTRQKSRIDYYYGGFSNLTVVSL